MPKSFGDRAKLDVFERECWIVHSDKGNSAAEGKKKNMKEQIEKLRQ